MNFQKMINPIINFQTMTNPTIGSPIDLKKLISRRRTKNLISLAFCRVSIAFFPIWYTRHCQLLNCRQLFLVIHLRKQTSPCNQKNPTIICQHMTTTIKRNELKTIFFSLNFLFSSSVLRDRRRWYYSHRGILKYTNMRY